jgi:hypothetical protein
MKKRAIIPNWVLKLTSKLVETANMCSMSRSTCPAILK